MSGKDVPKGGHLAKQKKAVCIVCFFLLAWLAFSTFYSSEDRFRIVLTNYDFDLCLTDDCLQKPRVDNDTLFRGNSKTSGDVQKLDHLNPGPIISSKGRIASVFPVINSTKSNLGNALDEKTTSGPGNSSLRKRRLPQCLIIGARKGGTRALIEFLSLHPSIEVKPHEVHFFDNNQLYSRGLEWYRRQMPFSLPWQITVEKTPAYFVNDQVPERVYRMNSSIKLLLVVRNPVSRTLSDYTQLSVANSGFRKFYPSFETLAIDPNTGEVRRNYSAIRRSLYHRHMKKWLRYFKMDQIHLVSGEDLISDPLNELVKIEEFLGLPRELSNDHFYLNATRGFYCMRLEDGRNKCLGSSKGRSHVEVQPKILRQLTAFFRPHNRKFFRLVGRNFSWSR